MTAISMRALAPVALFCMPLLLTVQATAADLSALFPEPHVIEDTEFPTLYLAGTDPVLGSYYSFVLKATYSIERGGTLKLRHRDEELTIDDDPPPGEELKCGPRGGPENQTTLWFPYTGILLSGGVLDGVTSGKGREVVRALIEQDGAMIYHRGSSSIEYGYAPCVGSKHADEGWRTDGYISRNATISVRQGKRRLSIHGLGQVRPYAKIHYWGLEEGVPVPMRIVLITLDLARLRVVVQYQTAISAMPPVREVDVRSFLSADAAPASSIDNAQELQAIAAFMDTCSPPINHPPEPCATPLNIERWKGMLRGYTAH